MQSVWRLHPPDARLADTLARATGVSRITCQLLINRGVLDVRAAKRFLEPHLEALGEPYALPDMERGVERFRRAIARKEPILIFSDSDVDGISAAVILYELFCQLGAVVSARQSNRIADGYGLPESVVRQICSSAIKLVVLVDCGTNQPEAIGQLSSCGIETVIVDHHVPIGNPSRPIALINPHCTTSKNQRELSSAGIAFKVAQALLFEKPQAQLTAHIDLAALGTLADYSPLVGENRIIISEGLPRILRSDRRGLRQLCDLTSTTEPEPGHIARRLVPRLNASGRLGDASAVWHLLLGSCAKRLDEWLSVTEKAHIMAKRLHQRIFSEACEQVSRLHFRDQYIILVSGSGWHRGFMGPVASQLAERYGRAAIALAMDERCATGSGRSVPHLNLLSVLQESRQMLVRFGGHAQACGLTIERRRIESFRELINRTAQASLGREGLLKNRMADLELPLDSISRQWVEEISKLEPFGYGNERPIIIIRGLSIDVKSARRAVLSDGKHSICGKGSFGGVARESRYDVLASPLRDNGDVVLMVKDIKPALPASERFSGEAGLSGRAPISDMPCTRVSVERSL